MVGIELLVCGPFLVGHDCIALCSCFGAVPVHVQDDSILLVASRARECATFDQSLKREFALHISYSRIESDLDIFTPVGTRMNKIVCFFFER